ncbi:MAG: glycerophosphodiester phosphodiesterase family protein [Sediminibacterium sp.]
MDCSPATKIQSKEMPSFDQQGHRGCRGLRPENTIPAMIHALELGVTTLETDVVISKDKQAVLSHEPFFNHEISTTTGGKRVTTAEEKSLNLYQMTYEEIHQYDVGLAPHPRFPRQQKMPAIKPRLEDMIDSVINYCQQHSRSLPFFNIETKSEASGDNVFHPEPAEFVDIIIAVIQKKKIIPYVTIQSFDPRTLQYLHVKYPKIKTALLIEDYDKRSLDDQLKNLGFTPTIYSPAHQLVTPSLVQQCREKKMLLIPWTVNDLPTLQRLKDMGVNGIISDYPDLFAALK